MTRIIDSIVEKLQAYPADVSELATQAVKLSQAEYASVATVTEQLRTVVRSLVRDRAEESHDPS